MLKKITLLALCASLAFANPAQSASFGKSSSPSKSSSGPRTYNPPSRPAQNSSPSYQSARPNNSRGSLSGGESVGMTRSGVTQRLRDGTPRDTRRDYTPNNPVTQSNPGSNRPNYANPAPTVPGRSGYGGNPGYGNSPNAYGNNGGYNRPPSYSAPSRNFGLGAVVGAAALGALVGYVLHRDNSGNSYFTPPNNPHVAYDANGNRMSSVPQGNFTPQGTVASDGSISTLSPSTTMSQDSAHALNNANSNVNSNANNTTTPTVAKPQSSSSGSWGWLMALLALLGVGLGGAYYFFNRKKKGPVESGLSMGHSKSSHNFNFSDNEARTHDVMFGTTSSGMTEMPSTSDPRSALEQMAQQSFIDFQKNNRPSQIGFIQHASEPLFFDAIKDSVMAAWENKEVSIVSLEFSVEEVNMENGRLVGTVHYQGVIKEKLGAEITKINVDEAWHYVHDGNRWLLAGIEAINPELSEDVDGMPPKVQLH